MQNKSKKKLFYTEIIETVDETTYVKLFISEKKEINCNYKFVRDWKFPDFDSAFIFTQSLFFDHGDIIGIEEIEKEKELKETIKNRISIKEYNYSRLSRNGKKIKIFGYQICLDMFLNNEEFKTHYEYDILPWTIYAFSRLYIDYRTIFEEFLPTYKEKENIIAFSWNGNVFKVKEFLYNLFVHGKSVDKRYYNNVSKNLEVTINYMKENGRIIWHSKNCIYLYNKELWLNAKKIFKIKELMEKIKYKGKEKDFIDSFHLRDDVKDLFIKMGAEKFSSSYDFINLKT